MCYILWNFGLTIINCIITNGLVIAALITLFAKRIPFKMRAKTILGVSTIIGFSVSVNYFSTILNILKTELFILLIVGSCLLAAKWMFKSAMEKKRVHKQIEYPDSCLLKLSF